MKFQRCIYVFFNLLFLSLNLMAMEAAPTVQLSEERKDDKKLSPPNERYPISAKFVLKPLSELIKKINIDENYIPSRDERRLVNVITSIFDAIQKTNVVLVNYTGSNKDPLLMSLKENPNIFYHRKEQSLAGRDNDTQKLIEIKREQIIALNDHINRVIDGSTIFAYASSHPGKHTNFSEKNKDYFQHKLAMAFEDAGKVNVAVRCRHDDGTFWMNVLEVKEIFDPEKHEWDNKKYLALKCVCNLLPRHEKGRDYKMATVSDPVKEYLIDVDVENFELAPAYLEKLNVYLTIDYPFLTKPKNDFKEIKDIQILRYSIKMGKSKHDGFCYACTKMSPAEIDIYRQKKEFFIPSFFYAFIDKKAAENLARLNLDNVIFVIYTKEYNKFTTIREVDSGNSLQKFCLISCFNRFELVGIDDKQDGPIRIYLKIKNESINQVFIKSSQLKECDLDCETLKKDFNKIKELLKVGNDESDEFRKLKAIENGSL